jgi:heme oxygenase (staphylobilin-producing)
MIVVQNRLIAPVEMRERLEMGFKHASNMQGLAGFVSFKFLRAEGEIEPGKALYIAQTTWEDRASFEAWRSSDSFSRAHSGPESGGNSPLTAQVEVFEVAIG